MTQITLAEAQLHLSELIAELRPGEEVQIYQDDRPIARLTIEPRKTRKPRQPGSAIGMMKSSIASTSIAASKTTPNASKNCLNCTQR